MVPEANAVALPERSVMVRTHVHLNLYAREIAVSVLGRDEGADRHVLVERVRGVAHAASFSSFERVRREARSNRSVAYQLI